jgi:hypothetical protein
MTDTYLDGLLDELVTAEPREHWNDVLHRARRSRRRYGAIVAAVAVLALAPATWAAVDAFEGTPAPRSIQLNFLRFDAQAAARQYALAEAGFTARVPRADAAKAHGVLQLQTGDGPLDMWAAPELNDSGSCWWVSWESDLRTDKSGGFGSCTPAGRQAIDPINFNDPNHPAYMVVAGSVHGPETLLDVTLTDGSTATLPVAEHLFVGALPHGSHIATIVGHDANGDTVATWPPPRS